MYKFEQIMKITLTLSLGTMAAVRAHKARTISNRFIFTVLFPIF